MNNTTSKQPKKRPLKEISVSLGNVPALFWLLPYTVLIFGFGLIYYILPDLIPESSSPQFYHTTLGYEYNFLNPDAAKLRSHLQKKIEQNFVHYHDKSQVLVHGWQINAKDIRIGSLDAADFQNEFKMSFDVGLQQITYIEIPTGSPNEKLFSPDSAKMTVSLGIEEYCGRINDIYYCRMTLEKPTPTKIAGFPEEPDLSVLFPKSSDLFPDATTIALPGDLYNRMLVFGQAYRGFPSKESSGQLWRMMYFSAGIATLNTLGDIVPLTTTARILVFFQTLLSIVFLGLFGNSLANTILSYRILSTSRKDTPQEQQGADADKTPPSVRAKMKKRRA